MMDDMAAAVIGLSESPLLRFLVALPVLVLVGVAVLVLLDVVRRAR